MREARRPDPGLASPFIGWKPLGRFVHLAGMKNIMPIILALIPLVAVVSACVVAP